MTDCRSQNKAEREQASAEILGLKRTLDWANKKYNDAVQRRGVGTYVEPPPQYSVPQTVAGRGPSRQGSTVRDEDDAENLQRFVEFKKRQLAEEKARKEREALELRRLEEQRQKEEEDKRNKEIAEKAIAEYEIRKKREMDEENERRLQLQTDFRRYLEDAALPEEEIDRIMKGVPAPSNAVVSTILLSPYRRWPSLDKDYSRSLLTPIIRCHTLDLCLSRAASPILGGPKITYWLLLGMGLGPYRASGNRGLQDNPQYWLRRMMRQRQISRLRSKTFRSVQGGPGNPQNWWHGRLTNTINIAFACRFPRRG